MLIQFSVKNFRSLKNEVVFSMVSAPSLKELEENTVMVSPKLSLLKSAVIYGANESGKSNLLKAMSFMRQFIWNSSKEGQSNEKIPYDSYLLNTETHDKPSSFEIVFLWKGIFYRYGFSVDQEEVIEEWLYYKPRVRELEVFTRVKQNFKLSKHFKSSEYLIQNKSVRPNALLLSTAAQFNGEMATSIFEWLRIFHVLHVTKSKQYKEVTIKFIEKNSKNKDLVLEFIQRTQMDIEDFEVEVETFDLSKIKDPHITTIYTKHAMYNEKKEKSVA